MLAQVKTIIPNKSLEPTSLPLVIRLSFDSVFTLFIVISFLLHEVAQFKRYISKNMIDINTLDHLKTYKTYCTLIKDGINLGVCVAEVQIETDKLYIIVDYQETYDGETPRYRIQINLEDVDCFSGKEADFLISFPVQVPANIPLSVLRPDKGK